MRKIVFLGAGLLALGAAVDVWGQTGFNVPSFSLGGGDPTTGLIDPASDGYANWQQAGLNNIAIQAYIRGNILTVTQDLSRALGPGQTINGAGVALGTVITNMAPDVVGGVTLTGTGTVGTYAVNIAQSVP